MKPIRYGPFKILKQVGNNSFQQDFPSYMQMYSVVNVENLRLYQPPLISDYESDIQLPSIEDFSPEFLDELKEDAILDKRTCTSRRGNFDYVRLVLKAANQVRQSGLRWKRWGTCTLIFLTGN